MKNDAWLLNMGNYLKQVTKRIIDLHFTLHYLAVPLDRPFFMFGDNQFVITNSTLPHSSLDKHWYAFAYHKVRETIATGMLKFYYINSKCNPANVLTKNTNYATFWPLLCPLLFWAGDTQSMPSIVHHTHIYKPNESDRF